MMRFNIAFLYVVCSAVSAVAQQNGAAAEVQVETLEAPAVAESEIEAPDAVENAEAALLRGLDKLTGEIVEFETAAGAETEFERLRVSVEACQMRGAEHAVFIRIFDGGRPEGLDLVFSGWMFASSPALSALDHPRYDVWLQNCKTS